MSKMVTCMSDHSPRKPEKYVLEFVSFPNVDHVIQLSRGGSNWPTNLRPACSACNTQKGPKTLREWRDANQNALLTHAPATAGLGAQRARDGRLSTQPEGGSGVVVRLGVVGTP